MSTEPILILIESVSGQARDEMRKVTGDLRSLKNEAQSTGSATASSSEAMTAAAGEMSIAFAALGAAAAVSFAVIVAAANQAFNSVKAFAELTREFQNLSKSTSIAMDDLRGLETRFSELNLPVRALKTGLTDFQKAISENDTALGALGVTSKNTWAALLQAADAFSAMADGPNKSAYAQRLFGESAREWIPVLEGGSVTLREVGTRASEFGLDLERTSARALEAGDRMAELRERTAGFAQDLTELVLPAVSDFVALLNRLLAALRTIPDRFTEAADGLRKFVNAMPAGKQLLDVIALINALNRLNDAAQKYKGHDFTGPPKVAPEDTRPDKGPPPPERPTREKKEKQIGPSYEDFVKFTFREAERQLREFDEAVQRTQNELASGFARVFDGIVSGALSFKESMVQIFRSMVKLITDELARLLAHAAVKWLLKLGAKFLIGSVTGGVGVIPADVVLKATAAAPIGPAGEALAVSPAPGTGGAATPGPVTNVYLSTIDEKSVADHYRSMGGVFNVREYREQQAGAI